MTEKTNYIQVNLAEIKLLTYNLFLRPPYMKTNESDFKRQRMKRFLKLINDFDIICLQEVFSFGSDRKDYIIKKALKLGFAHFKSSPSPSFFSPHLVDAGLLILSKFPIEDSIFYSFKYSVLLDTACNKGVLYVKIKINNGHLHLFTAHTQATYTNTSSNKDLRSSVRARGQQLYELGTFIDKAFRKFKGDPESDNIVLAGDLNVDSRNCKYSLEYMNLNVPLFKAFSQNDSYNEYDALLTCLENNNKYRVRDILMDQYEEHSPATYGATYEDKKKGEVPVECVLTHPLEARSNQRLDYIFELIPNLIENKNEKEESRERRPVLDIDYNSLKVEKFFVQDAKITQLSDHFGLSVRIELI